MVVLRIHIRKISMNKLNKGKASSTKLTKVISVSKGQGREMLRAIILTTLQKRNNTNTQ